MKLLRGFGKNYFTLMSIQAYGNAVTLRSQISSFILSLHASFEEDTQEDDPPPFENELLPLPLLENKKPCRCNAYFTHLSRLMVLLNHYIPRCPYYTTYFAFRRTGIHPPVLA